MGANGGNRQSGIQRPGDPAKRITFELTSQLLSYGFLLAHFTMETGAHSTRVVKIYLNC